MKKVLFFSILFFSFFLAISQNGTIKGKVSDAITGETLIGVNIVYDTGKGTATDMDGNFKLSVPVGTYTLKISYVGYKLVEKDVTVTADRIQYLDIQMRTEVLREVEVVGDLAKTRETPVAFTDVMPAVIEEELASQDIPMILNRTPGVYATQQGGGDGDARINIRGFNQRNVAVMIDGIPVNDMENGWVYWSNWFGLDMVTRKIQVQRGLGASKLAIPSVGGTMNIMSKGIDDKPSLSIKQEIGNNGFMRTSLGFNSGQMKNGWGVTFAGSYKEGDGYVDMTWTKGYFYFLRVDKKVGKHLISLSAMGAPQEHGQRSYKSSISSYSTEYAKQVGVDSSNYIQGLPVDLGLTYNPNWGYLTRYTVSDVGDTTFQDREKLNEKKNYYHKPQFSLRDFWNVNDRLYISNIAYLSIGTGGGTGLVNSDALILEGPEAGLIDFQKMYDNNYSTNGTTNAGKGSYLRSAVNNHFWYGLLSTATWQTSETVTISGGIDLRSYEGEHYQEVYDLLGADYIIDEESAAELVDKTNSSKKRYVGDKINYYDEGHVKWGGLFGQVEYSKKDLTLFANVSMSYSGYKRIDYFLNKDLVIDGEVFEQVVGYNDFVFDMTTGEFIFYPDTFEYNGKKYTVNSPEARATETDWKWILGYTFKGGANYNISKRSNVFGNIGYISKAPRFNNVYDYSNQLYRSIENEIVKAAELGYSFFNEYVTLNVNTYYTIWENKPADYAPTVNIDDEYYTVNINGMDALHKGIEIEAATHIGPNIILEGLVSVGDWTWTSSDSARIYDDNQKLVDVVCFNAEGIKVGDAAQVQYRESIRWEVTKNVFLKASATWFENHYSNFDPLDLDPVSNPYAFDENGDPYQSWKIPGYRIVDIHAGYNFNYKKVKFSLNASVLNVFDEIYITDADNNDSYTGQSWNTFDARSAAVYFGLGRRFNISLKMNLI